MTSWRFGSATAKTNRSPCGVQSERRPFPSFYVFVWDTNKSHQILIIIFLLAFPHTELEVPVPSPMEKCWSVLKASKPEKACTGEALI